MFAVGVIAIIRDPGTEWTPAPKSVESQLVTLERNLVSSVVRGRVSVAARAWQQGDNRLLVVLIATDEPLPSGKQQARSAVLSMCASATSNPPSSIGTFASIPGASEAVCTGKNPAGKELHGVGIAWTKKNVFVIMGGSMPLSNAEAFAIRQNKAIPSSGVSPAIKI